VSGGKGGAQDGVDVMTEKGFSGRVVHDEIMAVLVRSRRTCRVGREVETWVDVPKLMSSRVVYSRIEDRVSRNKLPGKLPETPCNR